MIISSSVLASDVDGACCQRRRNLENKFKHPAAAVIVSVGIKFAKDLFEAIKELSPADKTRGRTSYFNAGRVNQHIRISSTDNAQIHSDSKDAGRFKI